jgi:hypothetical protein
MIHTYEWPFKGSAVLVHINQLFEFSGQILIIIRGYLWMDTIYTSSYIGNQLFWDWDLTVDIFISLQFWQTVWHNKIWRYIYIYTICNIKVLHCLSYCLSVNCQMSFTKPFISVISWQSVLLVDETRVPRENHWPVTSPWQTLSHKVAWSIY